MSPSPDPAPAHSSPVPSPRPARTPAQRAIRFLARIGVAALVLVGVGAGMTSCLPSVRATKAQIAALDSLSIETPGVPGRSLAYRRAGDLAAPRVIFIHGTPGSAEDYADYLVTPPTGVEVVSVDRLGFGRSTTGLGAKGKAENAATTSFDEQARAIMPLLVERGGRWPILVGHSLGGPIAARVAAEAPGRVGGLIILAGSLDPAHEDPRWYNVVLASGALRWLEPTAVRHSNAEMMASQREATGLAALLGKIACPVVIVHGTDDPLVPFANAEYTRGKLTSAASVEVIAIPGEGHFLPWNQEALVRSLIERLATNSAR